MSRVLVPTSFPLQGLYRLVVYLFLILLATNHGGLSASSAPLSPPTSHSLYLLLTAEMALTRNLKSLALKNYLTVANQSNDPTIAEEATLLAINLDKHPKALASAKRWAKLDPKNLQAHLIAMTLVIGSSLEEAVPYLKNALAIDPLNIDQEILEIQLRLIPESARALQRALSKIAEEEADNPYAFLTAAQSAAHQKDLKNAKRFVQKAIHLKPDLTRAIQLKARLIHYEHSADRSLAFLKSELQKNTHNAELALFYANALYENEEIEAATAELLPLINDSKNKGFALMLLGEIYANQKKWNDAKKMLDKAIFIPETKAAAGYLLGEIAEYQKDIPTAIKWYSNIPASPYHVPAVLRATTLLKKTKDFDAAIELLQSSQPASTEEQKYLLLAEIDLLNASKKHDEAFQLVDNIIDKVPSDPDVLLNHAITAIKLRKWDTAEKDLKLILKQNPNHASALHALGHLLSFDQKRIKESLQYATLALTLSPNNPQFMDSLGWIHYQLGNIPEAIHYLKEAHDLANDSEIAAHLGEVLWMNHQKEDALQVFHLALKTDQENEALKNTLKRLKIPPLLD